MTAENRPRSLDHLVLQVPGLETARERLAALGFTVAPDGHHPFGTANCCVFFADGTFLEPLAVADPAMTEATARTGNVFTRHALEFRDRNGPEGFSALVFGTDDATRDHGIFVEAGYSAGDILNFGRDFVAADGSRDRAEFRLAFAQTVEAPDCLFFTVERVAVPNVDRTALLGHPNGATGIARVVITASEPAAQAGFLQTVGRASAESLYGGILFRSGPFTLEVVTPQIFADETGLPAPAGDAPHFSAVAFACNDAQKVAEHLLLSGIEFNVAPAGAVVPPQPGQGTAFVFQPR
jgi:hypothetical protein